MSTALTRWDLAPLALAVAVPLRAQHVPTRALPAKPDAEFADPFTQVGAIRELKDGRVIVMDSRDKVVQVVDLKSGAAEKIGREGSGPGEYALPPSAPSSQPRNYSKRCNAWYRNWGRGKPRPPDRNLPISVRSEASTLLVARYPAEKDPIFGILTLSLYRVPTAIRSIVEDVIEDENHRRLGIAEALLTKAIELAREAGAGNVSLSANPSRAAAHQLYLKLGFKCRDTFAYIHHLK